MSGLALISVVVVLADRLVMPPAESPLLMEDHAALVIDKAARY